MSLDADGYPRVCSVCGKALVKSRSQGGLVFYRDDVTGQVSAWHVACKRAIVSSVLR